MFKNIRPYIYTLNEGSKWFFFIDHLKGRNRKDFEKACDELFYDLLYLNNVEIPLHIEYGFYDSENHVFECSNKDDFWVEYLIETEYDNINLKNKEDFYYLPTHKNTYIKEQLKNKIDLADKTHINYSLLESEHNNRMYEMDMRYLNDSYFLDHLGFPNYFVDYVYKAKVNNFNNIDDYINNLNISNEDKEIYKVFYDKCKITFEKDITYNEIKNSI